MIYLYFDKTGKLVETIQGEDLRIGSVDVKGIAVYSELFDEDDFELDDIWYLQKLPSGRLLTEVSFKSNVENLTVPYNPKADYKYFKDFQTYKFYIMKFGVLNLCEDGLNTATIRLSFNEEIDALGEVLFNVQQNVVKKDNNITLTQYEYLLLAYASRTLNEQTGYDLIAYLDSKMGSIKVQGVGTSTEILDFTYDKGVYVGTDDGYWYFWNGEEYQQGGLFQAIIDASITTEKLADGVITWAKLNSAVQSIIDDKVNKSSIGYVEIPYSGSTIPSTITITLTASQIIEVAKPQCVLRIKNENFDGGNAPFVYLFYKSVTPTGAIVFYSIPVTSINNGEVRVNNYSATYIIATGQIQFTAYADYVTYTKQKIEDRIDEKFNINTQQLVALIDASGHKINLDFDSTTYKIVARLYDKNNNLISSSTAVDLPIESVVVGGYYDDTTKKVVLTLQGGSTIDFSVADLVSGLQTEITAQNPLSSDLVDDTNHTHKFVTASEKDYLSALQSILDIANNTVGGYAFKNDTIYHNGQAITQGIENIVGGGITEDVNVTFGSAGNYKDVLDLSNLTETTDYQDNGTSNTQFKQGRELKIKLKQGGHFTLTGYSGYSDYDVTINGTTTTATGIYSSPNCLYDQTVVIKANSSNNYYVSLMIYNFVDTTLTDAINNKQNKLVAGFNIKINQTTNVIDTEDNVSFNEVTAKTFEGENSSNKLVFDGTSSKGKATLTADGDEMYAEIKIEGSNSAGAEGTVKLRGNSTFFTDERIKVTSLNGVNPTTNEVAYKSDLITIYETNDITDMISSEVSALKEGDIVVDITSQTIKKAFTTSYKSTTDISFVNVTNGVLTEVKYQYSNDAWEYLTTTAIALGSAPSMYQHNIRIRANSSSAGYIDINVVLVNTDITAFSKTTFIAYLKGLNATLCCSGIINADTVGNNNVIPYDIYCGANNTVPQYSGLNLATTTTASGNIPYWSSVTLNDTVVSIN